MRKAVALIITLGAVMSFVTMDSANTFPMKSTFPTKLASDSTLWHKIDSLDNKGLIKSAEDVLNEYYARITYEKDGAEKIKTVMYLIKYLSIRNENGLVQAIRRLEEETGKSEAPTRNIYYSLLAELYWDHYNNNAWRFANRTTIQGNKSDDIDTWSIDQILEHVVSLHNKALKNPSILQSTSLEKYDNILIKGSHGSIFHPTLHDFLAHRALGFYKNGRSRINRPIEEFQLFEEQDFLPPSEFAKVNYVSTDENSSEFNAMKIYVQLTRHHLNDTNASALIHWSINRLKYVRSKTFHLRRDSLYLAGLRELFEAYKEHDASAEAKYEIALFNHEQDGNEELGTSSVEAYNICKQVIKEYPDSHGAKLCEQLLSQIESKELLLQSEYVLIPNKPALIRVQHRNLSKIYFRIVPFSKKWEEMGARVGSKDFLQDHLNLDPINSWQTSVKNEGDYRSHSVEKEIPALPLGRYVILISNKEDFGKISNAISCSELWSSNMSMIHRRKINGNLDFYVLHRETGEPLSNVKATIYRVEYDYKTRTNKTKIIKTEKTDNNGFFFIKSDNRGSNFRVKLNKDNDYIDLTNNYHSYPRRERRYNPNERRTLFFTDRAIYRPGQIIYFKGIRYKSLEKNPVAADNEDVQVTFYDVNHQEISKLSLKTNEYGSFSGSFTIPFGLLKGRMHITDGHGQQYVQVEEYKRPKFEVNFNPVEGMFKLGSQVKVTGSAISYAGIPLQDAKVQFRVTRTMNFPYWCRYFYPWMPTSETKEIINGIVVTDNNGKFHIDFKAISDALPNEHAYYNYQVGASVTDITGETHTANTSVNVGSKALNLNIEVPDNVNLDEKKAFFIQATNLSGQPQQIEGKVKIEKLANPDRIINQRLWGAPDQFDINEKEFLEKFPHAVYREENNQYNWSVEKQVLDSEFDSGDTSGIQLGQNKDFDVGYYLFTATSKDIFGEEVTAKKIVRFTSLKMKKVPGNEALYVWPIKTNGEPGEQAKFILGSFSKINVLMQVLHKDSSIIKKWIPLNKGIQFIDIPIKEEYRGNFSVQFSSVLHNRRYNENHTIVVPYTNKELKLKFTSFRDVLEPGTAEKWSISVRGPKDNPAVAEMIATLYDASLESFLPHTWSYNVRRFYSSRNTWNDNGFFRIANYNWFQHDWNKRVNVPYRRMDRLNWFGFPSFTRYADHGYAVKSMSGGMEDGIMSMDAEISEEMAEVNVQANRAATAPVTPQDKTNDNEAKNMEARTNFNETAFFYPQLYSEKNGEVEVSFDIPESLTKWKMMGLAHTPDLKFGYIESHLVTKKDLMIEANAPRFVREGDRVTFSAKINNLLDSSIQVEAGLILKNAQTGNDIVSLETETKQVQIDAQSNYEVSWEVFIPDSLALLEYTCWASTEKHKDAERKIIPVLSNRMLVTESMPFHIRGKSRVNQSFKKLQESSTSSTLKHHALTLEVTGNPAWYVVQALPYLNEYPYPNAESIFGRFYANSLATYIANSNPAIKQVFEKWQNFEPDALLSNLEKNQELKSILLKETPWLLTAKNESEQKRKIALLFQVNSMTQQLRSSFSKLADLQYSNGGWSWCEGMPDNPSVTYRIMAGLGKLDHLNALTVKQNNRYTQMVQSAVSYMDNRIRERYEWLKTHSKNIEDRQISSQEILYLYARSFYLEMELDRKNKEAYDYFLNQCEKYWLRNNKYVQGMSALILQRNGKKSTANGIIESLKEHALTNEEMGMYWKSDRGYWWYQAPIETQAMLIEAFDEVANDSASVEEMQIWLIKQKQTQHWGNSRSTVEACYALLNRGRNWLFEKGHLEVQLGKKVVLDTEKHNTESGTGYVKKKWNSTEVLPEMGDVKVVKHDDGIAWGSVYWQYFEELDNITSHETPLSLSKKLFVETIGNNGVTLKPIDQNDMVKVGDKIKVRVELRVDRDMEFIHMKDMRSAGLEPENVLSQYKFQGGLGYYESTSDVGTDFFMDYLRKGTYVFEYRLIATISGEFSNGITQIQCMYAPEFSSHSQGQRLRITR